MATKVSLNQVVEALELASDEMSWFVKAVSTVQRNSTAEDLGWFHPIKRLSRATV
jgi:hypothetical protein